MRSICLFFQVHQPFRLRTYRFFNIGVDHQYYDDYQNRHIVRRVAEKCYLPANKMMLDLIKEYGTAFKVSFSISGSALEQFEMYAPEVLKSFRQLADTGCVEFLAEPYSHSLAAVSDKDEFKRQVGLHMDAIEKYFKVRPVTFRNAELIYSDTIGESVAEMGFSTMITEGAKNVLGWKSPNYIYCNVINPKLKLFLRNFRLSDDIAFRFSEQSWAEYPLTADKFVGWLNNIEPQEEVVNLFLDYETIGERQWKETGIFDFFWQMPKKVFSHSNFSFGTPAQLTKVLQPVATLHVPFPISWADEERDLNSWLGNELQDEAFSKLYSLSGKVYNSNDKDLLRDWNLLQTSDHFYYMCTKWFSDGDVHKYFNPYASPYEAFINYMNVLSDFIIRLDNSQPEIKKEELKPEEKTSKRTSRTRKVTPASEKLIRISRKEISEITKAEKLKAKKVIKKKAKVENPFKQLNFDDIINLSDRKVKEVIKNLDIETVSYAMKGADKEVRQKVEKNLGKRAMKAYKEILRQIKTLHHSEITKSRKLFEKQIKSLTR